MDGFARCCNCISKYRHIFYYVSVLLGVVPFILLASCVGGLAPYTQSSWTYESAGKPAPDIQWSKTYGDAGIHTFGSLLIQTNDGGYVMLAYKWDECLIKTDADGNQLWERVYDDDKISFSNLGQQTADGGYILCGEYNDECVYVFKTDIDGNKLWDKKIYGNEYGMGQSIQQTTDGGYIMSAIIDRNEVLIKMDADGNELWDRTFDIPDLGYGYAVQQTKDGGYIIAGNTLGGTMGSANDDIMWLIKTGVDGNQLWYKVYKGGYGWSAQQTMDGGYIMCGVTNIQGPSSILLIKTDIDGNELWSKIFNYMHPALERAVQQTDDGGYILCGHADDWSGENWLIKTDAAGNRLWDKKFGEKHKAVVGYSVQQTADGGYIMCGEMENPPEDYNRPHVVVYNILLVKIAPLP